MRQGSCRTWLCCLVPLPAFMFLVSQSSLPVLFFFFLSVILRILCYFFFLLFLFCSLFGIVLLFSLQPQNYLLGFQRQNEQTLSWVILIYWLRSVTRFFAKLGAKVVFIQGHNVTFFCWGNTQELWLQGAHVSEHVCRDGDRQTNCPSLSSHSELISSKPAPVLKLYKCTCSSPCPHLLVFNRCLNYAVYVAPWSLRQNCSGLSVLVCGCVLTHWAPSAFGKRWVSQAF